MDVSTLLKERLSEKLKDFSAKLLPGTERERILGVKVPELRKLAKEIANSGDYRGFLEEKHYYLEETLLHGLILGYAKLTTEALIGEIEKFSLEKFGSLGGYAQQYLFFYARENKIGL